MKSAMEAALDGLSRRAMTCFELEGRLKIKGFSIEEINEVIFRLKEWDYLNDRRFALDFCQMRLKNNSRCKIREGLLRRGLDRALIDEVLEENYSTDQEFERCLILAKQLWEREKQRSERLNFQQTERKPQSDYILLQKVGRKLVQRGYTVEMVGDCLKRM